MTDNIINNAELMPKYRPFCEVSLEESGDFLRSPDWVKSIIMAQVNIETASPDGKLSGMPFVLDHLAEMGVNCVWLNPINDGRHYYNYGPATVKPAITGTEDYNEGWKRVAEFVKEAHKRNIRVLFDIVTWGCNPDAPLVKEHPDWVDGYSKEYKGPLYNWKNTEFFDWFSEQLLRIIRDTDADGFRADGSINYCGPEIYSRVRRILHGEGKYIAIIGEAISEGTEFFFDFNEHSINYWTTREGTKFIEGQVNFVSGYKPDIVSAVLDGKGLDTMTRQAGDESGKLRFYTSIVSCHDSQFYVAKGSLIPIVYTSILSPFIPLWYIGEEWNNPYTGNDVTKWLYANVINWDKLDENRDFYEKVKKSIRIRRTYPEIFEYFPKNHREINFAGVETDCPEALPAYIRTHKGYGIAVIPNYTDEDRKINIKIPVDKLELSEDSFLKIYDLLEDELISSEQGASLELSVKAKGLRVIGITDNSDDPFAKFIK